MVALVASIRTAAVSVHPRVEATRRYGNPVVIILTFLSERRRRRLWPGEGRSQSRSFFCGKRLAAIILL